MSCINLSILFVLTTAITLVLAAPYHPTHPHRSQQLDNDEPRQVTQLVSGLVGTAVGTIASPVLGGFAPLLGNAIGSAVAEAITGATTMALTDLMSGDLLATAGRDQESFPMKTYVINVPNVGPYVVMVRPEESEADKDDEGDATRAVFPGTEADDLVGGGRGEAAADKELVKREASKRVEIVPYHKLQFFRN